MKGFIGSWPTPPMVVSSDNVPRCLNTGTDVDAALPDDQAVCMYCTLLF